MSPRTVTFKGLAGYPYLTSKKEFIQLVMDNCIKDYWVYQHKDELQAGDLLLVQHELTQQWLGIFHISSRPTPTEIKGAFQITLWPVYITQWIEPV